VHRGVISTLSVMADASSSWFRCIARNKLGLAEGQTEFYVSGSISVCTCVFVCMCLCVCVCVCVCVCGVCLKSFRLKNQIMKICTTADLHIDLLTGEMKYF